ncbi:MAG: PDZ domain-containing protein [bacterium]|nr:PDZ domain-containing protein [bacterium]
MSTREIDGRAVEFGTSGYTMDHVFVLYDRASNNVWYPDDENLQAVAGKRKGQSLSFRDKPAPMPLGEWLDAHPGSTVLLPTERDFKLMNRPYLGIGLEDAEGGVLVTRVMEGSAAEEAGFLEGDVLFRLDRQDVAGRRALREILLELDAGDTVTAVVRRNGKKVKLKPELKRRADD